MTPVTEQRQRQSTTAAPPWAAPGALRQEDPEVAAIVAGEAARQAATLQLAAAENFASPAVLAALGSPLANKYAEGYPGARHHGGCEFADRAEQLACDRARELFRAEHVNVQPHSGSAAMLAAYAALLRPGDTVLALALPHGGHLTSGSSANFSGGWFDIVGYGLDPDSGLIDYDRIAALAETHRPKVLVWGSVSYPRHPDYAALRAVADRAGAVFVVNASHPMGLIAGGEAPSPVPYADVTVATTHKVLRGPRGGMILCGRALADRIDRAVFPFSQGGAQVNTVAATAVAFGEAAGPAFAGYARRVVANARALAAGLAELGCAVNTGGTDTHLVLADPAPLGVTGRTARERLAAAGLVVDTCALPYGSELRGIRVGTAALTTQGMGEPEMAETAALFVAALRGERGVRERVGELAERFPPYPPVQ